MLGWKHYRPFHFLMKRTIFACDVSNVADKGNDTTAMKSTETIMTLLMMRMIFWEKKWWKKLIWWFQIPAQQRDMRSERKATRTKTSEKCKCAFVVFARLANDKEINKEKYQINYDRKNVLKYRNWIAVIRFGEIPISLSLSPFRVVVVVVDCQIFLYFAFRMYILHCCF